MIDATGKHEFSVGDYIIYAASAGRNGDLRYGKVIRETSSAETGSVLECITVEKAHDYKTGAEFRLQNKGKTVCLTTGWNKLIIQRAALPEEVQLLLDSVYC